MATRGNPKPKTLREKKATAKAHIPERRIFNFEICEEILWRMCNGQMLRHILKSDPERYPTHGAFYLWLNECQLSDDPRMKGLLDMYTRAQEFRALFLEEEIIELADNPLPAETITQLESEETGEFPKTKKETRRMIQDAIARSALAIDSRKWVAARLSPKRNAEAAMKRAAEKADDGTLVIVGGLPDED